MTRYARSKGKAVKKTLKKAKKKKQKSSCARGTADVGKTDTYPSQSIGSPVYWRQIHFPITSVQISRLRRPSLTLLVWSGCLSITTLALLVYISAGRAAVPPLTINNISQQILSTALNIVFDTYPVPSRAQVLYDTKMPLDNDDSKRAPPSPVLSSGIHTINIDGLFPGTVYYYAIVAEDATIAGSLPIQSDTFKVKTPKDLDVYIVRRGSISTKMQLIAFRDREQFGRVPTKNARVYYKMAGGTDDWHRVPATSPDEEEASEEHTIDLSNLTADTEYLYYALAWDDVAKVTYLFQLHSFKTRSVLPPSQIVSEGPPLGDLVMGIPLPLPDDLGTSVPTLADCYSYLPCVSSELPPPPDVNPVSATPSGGGTIDAAATPTSTGWIGDFWNLFQQFLGF